MPNYKTGWGSIVTLANNFAAELPERVNAKHVHLYLNDTSATSAFYSLHDTTTGADYQVPAGKQAQLAAINLHTKTTDDLYILHTTAADGGTGQQDIVYTGYVNKIKGVGIWGFRSAPAATYITVFNPTAENFTIHLTLIEYDS